MTPHVLDQLPLWIEGDLGASEQAAVEGHLADCPACRVAAEELKTSQAWLREALASPFNASDQDRLRRRVLDQIRAEAPAKPVRRYVLRPGLLLTACTASLLIATLVWRQGGRHEDRPLAMGPPPAPPVAEHPSIPEPPPLVVHRLTKPSTRLQARAAPNQESAPPPTGGPSRIEFQTKDPTIRIIWLAQSGPLPDTHQTFEEKS